MSHSSVIVAPLEVYTELIRALSGCAAAAGGAAARQAYLQEAEQYQQEGQEFARQHDIGRQVLAKFECRWAEACAKNGQRKKALSLYSAIIQRCTPDVANTFALQHRAQLYRTQKQYHQAEQDLLAAVAACRDNYTAAMDLVRLYFHQMRQERVLELIAQCTVLLADESIGWANRIEAGYYKGTGHIHEGDEREGVRVMLGLAPLITHYLAKPDRNSRTEKQVKCFLNSITERVQRSCEQHYAEPERAVRAVDAFVRLHDLPQARTCIRRFLTQCDKPPSDLVYLHAKLMLLDGDPLQATDELLSISRATLHFLPRIEAELGPPAQPVSSDTSTPPDAAAAHTWRPFQTQLIGSVLQLYTTSSQQPIHEHAASVSMSPHSSAAAAAAVVAAAAAPAAAVTVVLPPSPTDKNASFGILERGLKALWVLHDSAPTEHTREASHRMQQLYLHLATATSPSAAESVQLDPDQVIVACWLLHGLKYTGESASEDVLAVFADFQAAPPNSNAVLPTAVAHMLACGVCPKTESERSMLIQSFRGSAEPLAIVRSKQLDWQLLRVREAHSRWATDSFQNSSAFSDSEAVVVCARELIMALRALLDCFFIAFCKAAWGVQVLKAQFPCVPPGAPTDKRTVEERLRSYLSSKRFVHLPDFSSRFPSLFAFLLSIQPLVDLSSNGWLQELYHLRNHMAHQSPQERQPHVRVMQQAQPLSMITVAEQALRSIPIILREFKRCADADCTSGAAFSSSVSVRSATSSSFSQLPFQRIAKSLSDFAV